MLRLIPIDRGFAASFAVALAAHAAAFALSGSTAEAHARAAAASLGAMAVDVERTQTEPRREEAIAGEAAPATPPIAKPKTSPVARERPPALDDGVSSRFIAAAAAIGKAARALVREDDAPDATSIATGDAAMAFGVVAGDGTGRPTTDPRASFGGKDGGRGASIAKDAQATRDRSRGAHVVGGYANDCEFPREAGDILHASADVVVHVRADGRAAQVIVVRDPGHGFGEAARRCALRHAFVAARDRGGRAVDAITAPITVRFTR